MIQVSQCDYFSLSINTKLLVGNNIKIFLDKILNNGENRLAYRYKYM